MGKAESRLAEQCAFSLCLILDEGTCSTRWLPVNESNFERKHVKASGQCLQPRDAVVIGSSIFNALIRSTSKMQTNQ